MELFFRTEEASISIIVFRQSQGTLAGMTESFGRKQKRYFSQNVNSSGLYDSLSKFRGRTMSEYLERRASFSSIP
jgi:hypothetical protein